MKLLAILRDSLKETLDVKLFYVMVGLSLIVVLLVGSITYKPVSVQERIEFVNKLQNLAIRQQLAAQPQTQSLDFHLHIEDFQKISDEPEPWLANYRLFHVVTLAIGNTAA